MNPLDRLFDELAKRGIMVAELSVSNAVQTEDETEVLTFTLLMPKGTRKAKLAEDICIAVIDSVDAR